MKRTRRLLVLLVAVACVSGYAGYRYLQHTNHASAIAATLEWGRLAPFPASAQQFVASPDVIDQWLRDSPGIGVTEADGPQPHVRYFRIVPGGGAQGAEVEVDDTTHTVKVCVFWS